MTRGLGPAGRPLEARPRLVRSVERRARVLDGSEGEFQRLARHVAAVRGAACPDSPQR